MIPNDDYLPPNNFVFNATIKPNINTIVIIVGKTKSEFKFPSCLYSKYVNNDMRIVYNIGPNISGSSNSF